MKRGFYFGTSLVFVFLLVVSIFAQDSGQKTYGRTETIAIDDFDAAGGQGYTWTARASQFITTGYPRLKYFKADGTEDPPISEPYPLRNYKKEREQKQILGVQTAFDRKADNWLEIYPVPATGGDVSIDARGIPLDANDGGQVTQVDFWVWGAGLNFSLEVILRDSTGRVHVLPAGKLNFRGWRNVTIPVPSSVKQIPTPRAGFKNLYFVGFRVRSAPTESVANFTIFLDRLQYTAYRDSNYFDGYELLQVDLDEASAVTPPPQEAVQ